MNTPEEMKEEIKPPREPDLVLADDLDPLFLINHPIESIVLDEETGHVTRKRLGKRWRFNL